MATRGHRTAATGNQKSKIQAETAESIINTNTGTISNFGIVFMAADLELEVDAALLVPVLDPDPPVLKLVVVAEVLEAEPGSIVL